MYKISWLTFLGHPVFNVECNALVDVTRVARCPVFDRIVRFFGHLSGQKYDAKPDN